MHSKSHTTNAAPKHSITPQEWAHKLLFDVPGRNWHNYDAMDRIFTIAIRLAEEHTPGTETISLLQQYGRTDIIQEMKQLQSSLRLLASQGEAGLSPQDRQALAANQQVIYAMVRQSLITIEANHPAKPFDISLTGPDHDGYWQQRIKHMQHISEHADSSIQFGYYLLNVQRIVSLLYQMLNIEETNAPQRH